MTDAAGEYARVHAIVSEARRLSGRELDVYLTEACAGDRALRTQVEALLDAGRSEVADELADEQVAGVRLALEGVLQDTASEWIPKEIGGYRVLREIGRGGMGVVYEAEQASPHRRVAIKLLHPLHATPERLRRFRREAELLGRLQHPGIAQIFEAGSYDVGRGQQPFFAMELVEGVDLRTHCERAGLDRRARVALLAQVADAVEYAHDHGVIHRDLKPDNVLADAHGQPKVLDFGIARVEGPSATLSTLMTEEGQLVGTLAYMAPEQLEREPDAITPLVDVYALGVLAFELLVGRLPFELGDLSISQALSVLARSDPPRARTLDGSLRGDLDTILAKALEPERARRYASAAAFAADLRRHLDDRPIHARPPSRVYLARKFTRRHRGLVVGAVATVVTLVAGVVVSLMFADEARDQRDVANELAELASANERRALNGVLQSAGTLLDVGRPMDALSQLWLVPHEQRGFAWWLLERQAPLVVEGEQGYWQFLDEDRLVLGGDEAVFVYSLPEQRITRELFPGAVAAHARSLLQVTPSGVAVSYHSPEQDILLLDLERERVLERLPQPRAQEELPGRLFGQAHRLPGTVTLARRRYPQVSLDGRTVLRFPDADTAEVRRGDVLLRRVESLSALETARLGPDGRLLAVNRRAEVTVVDLESGALRFRHAPDPEQGAVAIPVRDGLLLFSAPDVLYSTGLDRFEMGITGITPTWGAERAVWQRVDLSAAGVLEPSDPFASGWETDLSRIDTPVVRSSPDGRILVERPTGASARFVDLGTGEPLEAAVLGPGPDGRGGWLSFQDGRGKDGLHGNAHVFPAPSMRRVAVGHSQYPAVVVELGPEPDRGVLTLRGHADADGSVANGWIYHLAVSHDGSLLASAAPDDPSVRLWDTRTGEPLARLERGFLAEGTAVSTMDAYMAFTADDEQLVLTTPYEGSEPRVVVWDLVGGGVELPSAPLDDPDAHLATLLERFLDAARPGPRERLGQRAHTLGDQAWVALARPKVHWAGARPEPGPRWRYAPARGETFGLAVHPERDHVAMLRSSIYWGEGRVETHWIYALAEESSATPDAQRKDLLVVLDARTGERLVERELDAQPWCAAYSPDGATLAVGTHQGRLLVFDTEHYEQQLDWQALDSYVYSLAWTPDGTRLVTVGGDATVRVWDSRRRVVARRQDDAWRALRASMAEREDLAEVYASLEGDERAAARAELMLRRGGG